jgi:hypothetical protein
MAMARVLWEVALVIERKIITINPWRETERNSGRREGERRKSKKRNYGE